MPDSVNDRPVDPLSTTDLVAAQASRRMNPDVTEFA
jgi:hypothetical protein